MRVRVSSPASSECDVICCGRSALKVVMEEEEEEEEARGEDRLRLRLKVVRREMRV